MSAHIKDTVKPCRKNPACGYILLDGQSCNKRQQYSAANVRRYFHKHFKDWCATKNAASACVVTGESTSDVRNTTVHEYSAPIIAPSESGVPVGSTSAVESSTTTTGDESSPPNIAPNESGLPAGSTLAVEPNTTTTVDESSPANIVTTENNVPAESTSAVEPNTTTTVDESSAPNIVASERIEPAGSTSTVDTNTATTADESSGANIIASERVRIVPAQVAVESNTTTTVHASNISNHHVENEVVHPEPSINDDEFNTGDDFFVAQDDGHDGNSSCVTSNSTVARSRTSYNEYNDNAELPATIEISDTAIVTNSRQSRAISSETATLLTPEVLSFIDRLVQENVRL